MRLPDSEMAISALGRPFLGLSRDRFCLVFSNLEIPIVVRYVRRKDVIMKDDLEVGLIMVNA